MLKASATPAAYQVAAATTAETPAPARPSRDSKTDTANRLLTPADIINSRGFDRVDYVVMDGGSTDNSVDVIKSHASKLKHWQSEKDAGMYHAIQAGMDMGIVNAGMVGVYDELDPELRERVEDVVLNRRPDAGERLVEIAEHAKGAARDDGKKNEWRAGTVQERLSHALVAGITDFITEDTEEAYQAGRPSRARRSRRS